MAYRPRSSSILVRWQKTRKPGVPRVNLRSAACSDPAQCRSDRSCPRFGQHRGGKARRLNRAHREFIGRHSQHQRHQVRDEEWRVVRRRHARPDLAAAEDSPANFRKLRRPIYSLFTRFESNNHHDNERVGFCRRPPTRKTRFHGARRHLSGAQRYRHLYV